MISGSIDDKNIRNKLNLEIDDVLKKYKNMGGEKKLKILGNDLDKDPIGKTILAEHNIFKGFSLSLFNQKICKRGLNIVLENLNGEDEKNDKITEENKKKLKEKFVNYEEKYKMSIGKYLRKDLEKEVKELLQEIKNLVKDCGNQGKFGAFKDWVKGQNNLEKEINWNGNIKNSIQDFIALIFALWTIMNASTFFELDQNDEDKESYLFMPHAAQILSILRIFGCGDGNNLQNNLVQIGTGEGKSVTLAITSSIFALLGFDVYCACYSEYLSNRDFESFRTLFEKLEIKSNIHYGTFSKICERVINDQGDLRKAVSELITTGKNEINNNIEIIEIGSKPRILLIDEVDVFFGKDFYGELYTPNAILKDQTIFELLQYIWREKESISFHKLKTSNEFLNVVNKFKGWEQLIEEQTKCMVADLKDFQGHGYIVDENKIGYKDQDKIEFNIVIGYKTLFAYMYEMEKGTIKKSEGYNNLYAIGIGCGNFSYAEIPLKPNFNFIMGVSGTLDTLNEGQKKVISDVYGIKKKTYAPSVFKKDNHLDWEPKKYVSIVQTGDYFNEIIEEIKNRLQGNKTHTVKRAVIVVFEDKKKVMEFHDSEVFEEFRKITNIMTEELNPSEKERVTKAATFSNRITLITKSFGRGTDFICRDDEVRSQGGVHVLQVFFSKEVSEEVQIIGRTARQGDPGSFSMILLDSDLEYFLLPRNEFFDQGHNGKFFLKENKENYYRILDEKRKERTLDEFNGNKNFIDKAKNFHLEAKTFMEEGMKTNDVKVIKKFLLKWNMGPNLITNSRTLVLMDATGSMSALLDKCKQTVMGMFERAGIILSEIQIDPSSFYLQFAVYRNYSSEEQDILENSGFENNSIKLREFVSKITAKGGQGNEAIEIGLWHANNEVKNGGVSQVILIGDSPANSELEVKMKRMWSHGNDYWTKSKFRQKTHYKVELEKLKKKNIKVHAFYVDKSAKTNFREIADYTGGQAEFLDVNGPNGEELLTKFVTEEILKDIGEKTGVGAQALVDSYRKKYN